MREGEVPAGGDLLFVEIDVIDREEVGVDVVLVVKDPDDLSGPLCDRLQPRQGGDRPMERGQPLWAFPFPPSCLPRAWPTMMSTIDSSCSSVRALDFSSAS